MWTIQNLPTYTLANFQSIIAALDIGLNEEIEQALSTNQETRYLTIQVIEEAMKRTMKDPSLMVTVITEKMAFITNHQFSNG